MSEFSCFGIPLNGNHLFGVYGKSIMLKELRWREKKKKMFFLIFANTDCVNGVPEEIFSIRFYDLCWEKQNFRHNSKKSFFKELFSAQLNIIKIQRFGVHGYLVFNALLGKLCWQVELFVTCPPPHNNYDLLVGSYVKWKRHSLSAWSF